MKNLKYIGAGALAVVVVVSLASNVRAGLLSYTVTGSVPFMPTPWSSSVTVPQFPTSLGTLESVTLNLGSSMSTTLTAGNISFYVPLAANSSGSASTVVQLTLQDSSGSLTSAPQLTFMSPFETYNLSDGSIGAPGTTDSWSLSAMGSSSTTYTDAHTLGEFSVSGSGNITLSALGNAITDQINTGGASYAAQTSDAGVIAAVTYTYSTTAPEPTTFALLGSGMAALLAFWRWQLRTRWAS
jgi:hypothetical protein